MSDRISDRPHVTDNSRLDQEHRLHEASLRCFDDVYGPPPRLERGKQTAVQKGVEYNTGMQPPTYAARVSSAERDLYSRPIPPFALPDGVSEAEKTLAQKRCSDVQEHVTAMEVGTVKAVYGLGNGAIDLANLALSPPMRFGNWLAATIKDQPTAMQDAANFGTDVGKALVSAARTEQALQKYLHQVQTAQQCGDYGKPVRDLQHGIESLGKRWEQLTPAQKTEAVVEQAVLWVTPVAAERVTGAALLQATKIMHDQPIVDHVRHWSKTAATHVDKAVMDTANQSVKAINELAKTAPDIAEQSKQMLYDYLRGKGLTGPELEYAGIPSGYFDGMQPATAAKGDNFHAMSKPGDVGGDAGISKNPAPRSLNIIETRDWYNAKVAQIDNIEQQMRKEGKSAKEIFETTTKLRNEAKQEARDLMKDRAEAKNLERKYPLQTEEEILAKYGGDYEKAIAASKRTNPEVNRQIEKSRQQNEHIES